MRFMIFLFLALAPLNTALFADGAPPTPKPQLLDVKKVFGSAPVIYTLLSAMSVASLGLWLYSLATFRARNVMPVGFTEELRSLLRKEEYGLASELCKTENNVLASLIQVGLTTRKLGPTVMIDAMKSEGKRAATHLWQRLSLLNDIVIIAPMLGLLGTVIGMFYAFYDVNRSVESINALFDGLGIAVGTTVMGLIVAILAMMFYTTLKYRIVKSLSLVENEALVLSALIESK